MSRRTALRADTLPYWLDSAPFPTFGSLEQDEQIDVVVVGAGITGLTAPYLLGAAGRSVIVLERDRCARIDTGHTTAHLTMVTDTRLGELVRRFGRDHARAVWDAGLAAIAQIDSIVQRHEIECEFEWVDGYLHRSLDAKDGQDDASFDAEATLARELGFDAEF